MDYKAIRNMMNGKEKFEMAFEMSKDGKSVRAIGTEINTIKDGVAFVVSTSGVKRTFGLRTLYRHSWNKGLPYEIEGATVIRRKTSEEKAHIQATKEERAKRRALIAATRVKKGNLLSEVNHKLLIKKLKVVSHPYVEIITKRVRLRVIIRNENMLIVKTETRSARTSGYFFYNLNNMAFLRFNRESHQKGYGNENIQWPKLAA